MLEILASLNRTKIVISQLEKRRKEERRGGEGRGEVLSPEVLDESGLAPDLPLTQSYLEIPELEKGFCQPNPCSRTRVEGCKLKINC